MVESRHARALLLIILVGHFFLLAGIRAHAQTGGTFTGSGSLGVVPRFISNDPQMEILPQRTPAGPIATVSYTLHTGYDHKLDLTLEDESGTILYSQNLVMPYSRFSVPVPTAGLQVGRYKVSIRCGNLIHSVKLRIY